MKKLLLKPYNSLIMVLLGLIGTLTGCKLADSPVAEYGVPNAEYEIKGTVTDSITSTAVQNLRVVITQTPVSAGKDTSLNKIDTVAVKLTDSAGKYDISVQEFPLDKRTFNVKVEDTDGTANGGDFQAQAQDAVAMHSDLTGAKTGWSQGKAVKIVDFKLKKK